MTENVATPLDTALLLPFLPVHAERTFEWVNNPAIAFPMDYTSPVIWRDHLRWMTEALRDPTRRMLAVIARSRHIGNCGLMKIDRRTQQAALWIYLDPHEQGRGYGRQALAELIRIGFEEVRLNRIYLYVRPENHRAIKLYESAGFRREGLLRDHFATGAVSRDAVLMATLARDFAQQ